MSKEVKTVKLENKQLEVVFTKHRIFENDQKQLEAEVVSKETKTTTFEQIYEMLRNPPPGGWSNEKLDEMFTRNDIMGKLKDKKVGDVIELNRQEVKQIKEANIHFHLLVFSLDLARMKKEIIALPNLE